MAKRIQRVMLTLIMAVLSILSANADNTPYVVWCEDNATLYFTYRSETLEKNGPFIPEGETEGLTITSIWDGEYATPEYNDYGNAPYWNNATYKKLTRVVFEESFKDVRPTSTARWFTRCSNLTEISGIENLNTSEVTHMGDMFNSCSSLSNLDLSSFDTKKVVDMSFMFKDCSSLTTLNVGFSTENVSNMRNMFANCSNLETINLESFNTSKVTNMREMFIGCKKLTSLDMSRFDTRQVTIMNYMFAACTGLTTLDVSTFNTENVTNMYQMFYNNPNLTSITFGSGFRTPKVSDMGYMFASCKVLQALDLSTFSTECVTSMKYMFSQCNSLETVTFGTGFKCEEVTDMSFMFDRCTNLGDLDLSSAIGGKVETMEKMFYQSGIKSLKLGDLDATKVTTMKNMFRECNNLESITLNSFTTAAVTTTEYMFYQCKKLQSLDLSGFRTTELTTAFNMFNNCAALETLDISNFSVESATTLQTMFYGCSSLKSLDLSGLCSTSAGTYAMFSGCSSLESLNLGNLSFISGGNVNSMFEDCIKLKSLDLSKMNVSTIKDLGKMFYNCRSIESINLTNFNTESATNMEQMFSGCNSLTSIDLSSFRTQDVTRMFAIFSGCSSLTELDLSSFDTKYVKDFTSMFSGCENLVTIYVSGKWNMQSHTESYSMFLNCNKLVGGNGTTYKSSHVNNYEYARIDGEGTPGYFTLGSNETGEAETPYAIWCNDNKTLYFTLRTEVLKAGGTFAPEEDPTNPVTITDIWSGAKVTKTGNIHPEWWLTVGLHGTTVVFESSFADVKPTSTCSWFETPDPSGGNYVLTTIKGIEYLNTEEVTTMCAMFADNPNLKCLDVSHFKTGKVTNMAAMFYGCSSLTSLDVSKFNTSAVTNMESMFKGCSGLTSLDLSKFDTKNVENMKTMFINCSQLTTLDLTSFNTGNVTNIYGMFQNCSRLTSLDLSSFNTQKVSDMGYMFNSCENLKTIYVGELWSTDFEDLSSNYMFKGCTSIVGGKGTTYDDNLSHHIYAHIDGGASNPGYFTAKGQTDPDDDIINFVDDEVKRICVANWDTSGDGEISYKEAKAVTNLDRKFANNALITSFDELQYFTGLKALNYQEGGQFELCENLESIILPNSLEKIGGATFNYCRALKGITIPASVTEMSYLGGWYYGMTTITVAAGNTVYDSRNNCNAVIETDTHTLISGCNKTVIPDDVVAIGPFAFNACVTDPIAIPTSVTTIGRAAFSTCQFTEITLPSSITSIDISFAGCSQIKKVVSRIIEPFAIEDATFDQTVYNNATLWVPTDDAVSKYKNAAGWKNFKDIRSSMIIVVMDDNDDQQDYFKSECKYNDDNSLEIVNVDEASGDVEIPSAIVVDNNQIAVTSIADGAFANNNSITSVTIPATITSIGDGAFNGCNNLEYVDLSNASGLAGLTVDDVNRDGNGAFSGLSEGTVIVLPSSVSTTTAQAFSTAGPNIVYRDGSDYKSENVSLADKATFSVPESVTEVKVAKVSYGRTFNRNDVVYSICLPYDQPLAEGLKAYELEEFNNGSLVFKETGGAVISAGKPYLVTTLQSVDGMSAENVTMYIGGNGNDKVVTDYTFCGTLKTITNEEASQKGYLIMQSDKLWHPVPANNAAVNIPAGRAYLKPNNSNARAIKRTVLKDNDEVTYIKTIDYDGTATYYDLNGHRIGEPVKAGVYVKDGNKVVVK